MWNGYCMTTTMIRKRARIFRDPYTELEVVTLVENYEELNDLRSKAWVQVRLMDIDRAFAALRPKEKTAVLLCGLLGFTVRTASALVDVPLATMWRHYQRGLVNMASYLNGGT
jgi:DNA-directed RNA polymerase specialized sigma24 family protein